MVDINPLSSSSDQNRGFESQTCNFEIKKCEIVSAVNFVPPNLVDGQSIKPNRLDFSKMVVELNVYEDIFSNGMSGNLILSDSMSYLNKLSWCGDEFLVLEFTKTYLDDQPERSFKGIYRIYKPTKRNLSHETNEGYIIKFCSEEMFLSERIQISKTYKKKKISDIVIDIALRYLKINPMKLGYNVDTQKYDNIEETFDVHDISIDNMSPMQAINWLATIAIPSDPRFGNYGGLQSGAMYFFWRNRYGWYFKSILGIFNNVLTNIYPKVDDRQYITQYTYGTKNTHQETSTELLYRIVSYNIAKTYDSVERLDRGMFNNKLISYDYLRRVHLFVEFNYEKYFNEYLVKKVELYRDYQPHSLLSNALDRFDKKNNDYPDTVLKFAPSTTKQKENPYIKKKQPDITSNYVENTIPYRFAQISLLNYNKLRLLVPGDPEIAVGMLISIKLPQATRGMEQERKYREFDMLLSGIYLVSAVRHKLDQETTYYTILEIVKDSYSDDVQLDGDLRVGLAPFPNDDYYKKVSEDDYSVFDDNIRG